MDVVELILSEDVARVMPLELLKGLADVTNDTVMLAVKKYLQSANADTEVRNKVLMAYSDKINIEEFLADEKIKGTMYELNAITYDSISPLVGLEKLRGWADGIELIINSPYAVPYISPIKAVDMRSYMQEVQSWAESISDPDVKKFVKNLKTYSFLFKDKPSARAKGTIVKKVVRNKTQYEILLRGIKYLIKKLENGESPATWRYL